MTNPSIQTASFIVRFWLEPSHNGHSRWRGQVETVPKQGDLGQQAYFDDGFSLLTFLRSRLPMKEGGANFPDAIDKR